MRSELKTASARSLYRLRLEGLKALGGECACCHENRVSFLTFDHKVPLGRKTTVGVSAQIHAELAELRKNNWPDSNLQVLCMNCNYSKGNSPECRHTDQTVDDALKEVPRKNEG